MKKTKKKNVHLQLITKQHPVGQVDTKKKTVEMNKKLFHDMTILCNRLATASLIYSKIQKSSNAVYRKVKPTRKISFDLIIYMPSHT